MFCTRCGLNMDDADRYCPRCGGEAPAGMWGAASEPYPSTPGTQPRLTRSLSNKVIAGVCSGIARYSRLDLTLVRVLSVVLVVLSGGFALLGYLLAWAMMPVDPIEIAMPAGPSRVRG